MANSIIGQLQQSPLYNNMIDGLATAGSAAIAIITDAQSYIGSSLSPVVAQGQNYISVYLPEYVANALSLAQRTISTSIPTNIGPVSIGAAAGLGSVFLLPLVGNGFNIVRRTVTAYRQHSANQSIMFDKTHKVDTQERDTQLKDRAAALRTQAQNHRDRAASTGGGVTGGLKYLLTFLAPVAALPQIAVLTTAPFTLPAAAGLGGGAVLVRYLANRFDASRERAAAQVADSQAMEFDVEAEETERLMATKTEKEAIEKAMADLSGQFEQKANTLRDKGNEVVALQGESAEPVQKEHTAVEMPIEKPTSSKGVRGVLTSMYDKLVGRNYTSTVEELKNAKNAGQVRAILARDTHSTEELCALSRQLPDDVFIRMAGPFSGQLRTLEAKHHAELLINDCRDKKGVLDSTKLACALAQHREFITKSSDNMFFTDGANYVKARLTMPGTAACELLCRIRTCSVEEMRLPQNMMLESGVFSVLKDAQHLGGQDLKTARRDAAEIMGTKLRENHPKLFQHLEFQFWASNNICSKIEQMLLNQLEGDDYGELRHQMASQRANSCMEDITLKVKNFDQLSQRLDNIINQYNVPGATSEQLVGGLVGAQNLRSDAHVLGQLILPEHLHDKAWGRLSPSVLPALPKYVHDQAEVDLSADMARQLADQLSDKIEEMAVAEGITDANKIENALRLVHALRDAADDLDWDGEEEDV